MSGNDRDTPRSEFDRRPLWAPWRLEYIRELPRDGCFFCEKAESDQDHDNLVVARGETCFLLLNAFPYNSGHVLIAPYAHKGDLSDLPKETRVEMIDMVMTMKEVMSERLWPDGFNFGFNLGAAAGAGVVEHVHGHLVPRWNGDTNFMPVLGDTRVVPEALEKTAAFLREGWGEHDGT